jgi:hypothetical protein
MSLFATILKSVVSFLLLFRLQTTYAPLNFFISLMVTVACAFVSPVFYLVAREHENDFLVFSNHIADRIMAPGGLLYLIQLRNIVVLSVSAVAIIFCLIVEVTSWYIIQTIVEFLIGFWVVDQVNQFRESLFRPVPIQVEIRNQPIVFPHQLTKYDYVETGKKRSLMWKTAPQVDHVVKRDAKLLKRAKQIKASEMKARQNLMIKAQKAKMAGATLLVMDEWEH